VSFLRIVLENEPQGKRPLVEGDSDGRWEDRVKKYVDKVRQGMDWKEIG